MLSLQQVILLASATLGVVSASPIAEKRQDSWAPQTLNNTQEFYIKMAVTDGPTTYQEWSLSAWHTGAGTADPVFVNGTGSPAFLNGTNLQFDVNAYPFSFDASPSDTNYARWENVGIVAGFGSGPWVNDGSSGLRVDSEESDGWLVCEWVHGINAPQLFQMIKGFDGEGTQPYQVPSSCARVLLLPEFF